MGARGDMLGAARPWGDEDPDEASGSTESDEGGPGTAESDEDKAMRNAGEDFCQAVKSGDGKEVFQAFRHMKNVHDVQSSKGDDASGKSALVVAIGKAKPPGDK